MYLHEKKSIYTPNSQINGLIFLQNPKNPILGVFLSINPKMRFFPKNPAPSVF